MPRSSIYYSIFCCPELRIQKYTFVKVTIAELKTIKIERYFIKKQPGKITKFTLQNVKSMNENNYGCFSAALLIL